MRFSDRCKVLAPAVVLAGATMTTQAHAQPIGIVINGATAPIPKARIPNPTATYVQPGPTGGESYTLTASPNTGNGYSGLNVPGKNAGQFCYLDGLGNFVSVTSLYCSTNKADPGYEWVIQTVDGKYHLSSAISTLFGSTGNVGFPHEFRYTANYTQFAPAIAGSGGQANQSATMSSLLFWGNSSCKTISQGATGSGTAEILLHFSDSDYSTTNGMMIINGAGADAGFTFEFGGDNGGPQCGSG